MKENITTLIPVVVAVSNNFPLGSITYCNPFETCGDSFANINKDLVNGSVHVSLPLLYERRHNYIDSYFVSVVVTLLQWRPLSKDTPIHKFW